MPELTDRDIEAIHQTHDEVIRIKSLLGGADSGLCRDVKEHGIRLSRMEIIMAIILGSGILGGGIFSLISWLK